jgi:hypothetical protein
MATSQTFNALKAQYICTDYTDSRWSIIRTRENDAPSDTLQLLIHPSDIRVLDQDITFDFPKNQNVQDKRVAFSLLEGSTSSLILVILRNNNLTLLQVSSDQFEEQLSCPAHTNRLQAFNNFKSQASSGGRTREFVLSNYVTAAWKQSITEPFWQSRRPAPVVDDLGLGEEIPFAATQVCSKKRSLANERFCPRYARAEPEYRGKAFIS